MPTFALNIFQRLVRTWEREHPYNAAQVLTWGGELDARRLNEAWHEALLALGLGRVTVCGQEICHEILNGDADQHPVCVLPESTSLADYLSESLNQPFANQIEPPFRAFAIRGSTSFRFGVVYRHWVADSASIRRLIGTWCERILKSDAGADHTRIARLTKTPGYWKLFGPRYCDVQPGQTALDLFRAHMRFRRVLKVRATDAQDSSSRVILSRLPDGLAPELRSAAGAMGKDIRLTVGDLLQAALAESCDLHLPMQRRPRRRDLAIGNIVDLRQYLAGRPSANSGEYAHAFGLLLGFTQVFCTPAALRDFPRLVRTIALQNRAQHQAGVAQRSAGWMLGALAVGRLVAPGNLNHFYRKEIPLAAGFSNVRIADGWADRLHPSPLLDYLRVSPTGPMAPVVLSATTIGSHLNLALTYRSSVLSEQNAADMLASIARRLEWIGSMW